MTSDHAFGGSFSYINDSHQRAWTTAVNSGDGGRGWNDIVYASNSQGWVICLPVGFFHGLGKIYMARDSGHHWHAITPYRVLLGER
jgi:hypothetical protein